MEQWILFYQNIFNKYRLYKNCHFVIYEELTNLNYLNDLLVRINCNNIKNIDLDFFKNSNKEEIEKKYSLGEYEKAIDLYNKFKF